MNLLATGPDFGTGSDRRLLRKSDRTFLQGTMLQDVSIFGRWEMNMRN